jgi:hypothetical protein
MPNTICSTLLLLFTLTVPAKLQQPVPGLSKARQTPQQATTERRDSQVQKRGTDSLAIVGRIPPAQVEPFIAPEQGQSQEQNPTHDWWIIVRPDFWRSPR